jgi:hypothetical protein
MKRPALFLSAVLPITLVALPITLVALPFTLVALLLAACTDPLPSPKEGSVALDAYGRAQAVAPRPCPDWSGNPISNYQNHDMSNLGCAYRNDMIMQIADPADYLAGMGEPVSEAARDSVAIGQYQSGTASAGASGASSSSASSGSAGGSGQ